jgi:hypothetical protein
MSDTHDTTPQSDTPPVMVAIGADLIHEAINGLNDGIEHAQVLVCDGSWSSAEIARIEANIARMEATAKALGEAMPGSAA